jgi:hypothetical protein
MALYNKQVQVQIQPRAVNSNAVMAVRAMVGADCDDDLAIDIIEVLRPHLETGWLDQIRVLNARIKELETGIPSNPDASTTAPAGVPFFSNLK